MLSHVVSYIITLVKCVCVFTFLCVLDDFSFQLGWFIITVKS